MRATRLVVLLAGLAIVGGAGAWLLSEAAAPATEGSAVLRRPMPTQQEGASRFGADAPAAPDAPEPLRAAARRAPGASTALAEAPQTAAIEPFDLTLVHADGVPAAGATVLLAQAGALRASGLTDAAGRSRLVPGETSAATSRGAGRAAAPTIASGAGAVSDWELIVGGVSDIALRLPLADARGAQRVVLPAGQRIEGRVIVDGAPLKEPVTLALKARPKGREGAERDDAFADALWVPLPGVAVNRMSNAQLVAPDGRFVFGCLPDDWRGRFQVPGVFLKVGGDDALNVQAPATDVVVRLRSQSMLRGRVVGIGGGVPVPGAHIASITRMTSGQRGSSTFDADGEGRFALQVDPTDTALESVTLTITHPAGRGLLERVVSAEDIIVSLDLGDLELGLARPPLPLLVQDADGAPVPGAVAKTDDRFATRSSPTDDDGRTVLSGVSVDTATFTVWAHGFYERSAALPDPGAPAAATLAGAEATAAAAAASDGARADGVRTEVARAEGVRSDAAFTDDAPPLVVVLERCPTLEVLVKGADGAARSDLDVVVAAASALFSSMDHVNGPDGFPSFLPDPMIFEVGTTHSGASEFMTSLAGDVPSVSGSIHFTPDAAGRVSLSNLKVGAWFNLEVQDEVGGTAWGPEVLSLQPGEARVVECLIGRGLTDLVVRVIDPAGAPLERAYVEVFKEGKNYGSQPPTDADGFVTLKGLVTERVTLVAEKEGYATQRLVDVPVASAAPLVIVLQPGREVRVFVHDAQGRPVPAERVFALRDGAHVGQPRPDNGVPAGTQHATSVGTGVSGASVAGSAAAANRLARWLITEVPPGAVTIEARVGGRPYTATDTGAGEVDILVPETGALFVHCGFALDRSRYYTLSVQPVGEDAAVALVRGVTVAERDNGELNIPALAPGNYDVALLSGPEKARVPATGVRAARVTADSVAVVQLDEP